MAMVVTVLQEGGIMLREHQDDLIASNVVVLDIGLGSVLWVVVAFHLALDMVVVVVETVLEGIVITAAMMTVIVVGVMVKGTVELIVGTDMAIVNNMAVIVMHLTDMHRMDMAKTGVMSVTVQGEVIDMAVVAAAVLHVMREATEKDQHRMIVQVGADHHLMMIVINDLMFVVFIFSGCYRWMLPAD